ncbi:MAG: translation initiation factor IF-1 [Acidobacteriota bacterium]|nr:translation initiation factor IF-1 [Acidobacteriota bacterium]
MTHAVIGVVREQLPSALFRVEVDGRHQVVAHASEGLRRNFIRLLVGDRVRVELSASDAGRGRITERLE